MLPIVEVLPIRLFLQATSGRASDSLVAVVRVDSAGPIVGTLASIGTQLRLEDAALHLPAAAEPVRHFIEVRGAASDDAGGFRLAFIGPSLPPERVPEMLAVNDTVVGERLESVQDIDRFMFLAEAGAEYVIAVAMEEPEGATRIDLRIVDRALSGRTACNYAWDASTLEQNAARFTTVVADTHYVTVRGEVADGSVVPGPVVNGGYRLWLQRVDSMPESRPSLLAIGDTVVEAIDHVGDVDLFQFDALAGDELRLDVSFTNPQDPGIDFHLFGSEHGVNAQTLTSPPSRLDGLGWRYPLSRTGRH